MGVHPAPELRERGPDLGQLDNDVFLAQGRYALQLPREVAQAATWNHHSDAGNAELFALLHADDVRYDHARRRWLVWDGHRWRPDDDSAVHRMALEVARLRHTAAGDADLGLVEEGRKALSKHAIDSESSARLEAMLRLARTMHPLTDAGRGWDETPGLLGVPNGVVDLRTGELRNGRPDDRITMQAGVAYDPDATCPRWEEFLAEVLEDPDEVITWLQRLVGYSTTAEATLHLLIFLMGVGRNGKGAFIRALDRALGDYSRLISERAFDADARSAHTTEVTDLAGARFAYCEELGDGRLNAERLKDASGGGVKRARRMRSDTFEFRQTWLLWFTTNGLPRSDDNSVGWWERVRAISFPRQFTGPNADPGLDEALAAEAAGILNWVVRGAVDWYAAGLGPTPEAVAEKTAEYREDVDPLESLFEAGILAAEPEAFTPTTELYAAYRAWCATDSRVLYPLGEDGFAKALAGRFVRHRPRLQGSKVRGFKGVVVAAAPAEAVGDRQSTTTDSLADSVWPD